MFMPLIGFALCLSGCFEFNPHDLPGYDTSVDSEPDGTEMDTTSDQDVDRVEVDVETDPGDIGPEDLPAEDMQAEDSAGEDVESEDVESEDFVIDWEIPPDCGNGTIEPPDEECDGDEPRACTTSCGTEGEEECIGCRWVCFPPPDNNCNGVDEDCDGTPDDGYVSTGTCGQGVCENDTECVDGGETCEPLPPRSSDDTTCDDLDDDCDGSVDEDYEPYTCGLGVCRRDSVCAAGSESCTPGSQTGTDNNCNGLDDNCNGSCDENYTTTLTCGTGPCERFYTCACGTESCTPGTPISPQDTTCNNTDEDCDGAVDDDWVPTTCGFGVCLRNATCTSGTVSCTPGDPTGTDENCNGLDEDCDGTVDDGYIPTTCGVGACQRLSACTGGTVTCNPGTPAPDEICTNGVDDDCNGLVDDGCGSTCTPCTGAVDVLGTSPTGSRFTGTTAGSSGHSGTCGGGSAPEALYKLTIGTTSDVFITTHGTGFDTVVYVRECNCNGTQVACNDDADGRTTSMIHLRDLAAGTYNLFVDGKTASAMGSYQLDVYVTAPGLEGDRCGDPVRLTSAGYTYLSPNETCNLTADYIPNKVGDCGTYIGTGEAEEMVFYFYVPADDTDLTFSTCHLPLSDFTYFDTALYVRGICNSSGASNQLACAEDIRCGSGDLFRRLTTLTVTLDRGLYYLMVDGYAQEPSIGYECGEFYLSVTGL
jgi:hypothetical protein